jgi:hypothetical protein
MGADRPDDPDVPPDRRDDQDARGDQASGASDAQAETRTRHQYYTDLRVTVSRQESAVARQVTAEEQAASEKWQEKATESRWLWTEYQRKWPPDERPPSRNRPLDPADNAQVDAECDRIANREKERISPALRAIETQDPDRHLIGFDHRLKSPDRIKEKVQGMIKESDFPPERAISHVPDAIRYTFTYREARYTQGVWADIGRLKDEGFKLDKLKNSWSGDQYKGINSQWIEPDTGQRFEVQFHTRISFEAKQLTHAAYERLRTKQADTFEELVLEAFQKKVIADVPVPPGAADIPDYAERGADGR